MAAGPVTRVSQALYDDAKLAGEVLNRSTSQQIDHWARLGREIEASADVSSSAVGEVLRGARSYDTLRQPQEQAIVRAAWMERIEQLHRDLDMRKVHAGRPYAELDEAGNVVVRNG
ncbi:MAG TPA: hypothetical protein VHB69_06565 [Mycobacteriales bacterium]|nr:hypothetical protein [Mycobacteriales bacterium]